jgi:U1 zinc finger
MTERWVSTKKHYCKYCNTWIPDTKISRQQHDLSDRHKNAMQRNLSRIQRDELIKRSSGTNPDLPPSKPLAKPEMRRKTTNMTNYGYGDRDDMAGFIRDAKKNFHVDQVPVPSPSTEYVPQRAREGNIGEWQVTQIVSTDSTDAPDEVVKKEETPPTTAVASVAATEGRQGEGKRERARTPDVEDLHRFRVQEKTFPVEDNGEDVKTPKIGFKKRKLGPKNSRVSMVL